MIGVGEGTTASFPRHFFEYLKISPQEFYVGAEPTWKLGIKFLWGPAAANSTTRLTRSMSTAGRSCRRNVGFYHDDSTRWVGPVSALMAHDKAFPRKPDGMPAFSQRARLPH